MCAGGSTGSTSSAGSTPSFDFSTTDDLGLRVGSEQGREQLARLRGMTPSGTLTQESIDSQIALQEKRLEAIKAEEYRRGEPARIAQERMNLIASQQEAMAALKKQADDQIQSQQSTVADLQRQRDAGIAEIKSQANAQQAGIREQAAKESQQIGTNAGAVAASLRMLGMNGGKQGPTAAVAGRRGRAATAGRATSASLRMGATGRGVGSGANIAV